MAFRPSLFEEMKSQFGESIPSDAVSYYVLMMDVS
jgi:hypothetical protein